MAQIQPLVPGLDSVTVNPATGHTVDGFIGSAAAVPAGSGYAGVFAPNATLTIIAGAAAGYYLNTGTSAVPAWSAISHA